MPPRFSFIIPVYNRPHEVKELLESFLTLKGTDFEVVVVEDGSAQDCQEIVKQFSSRLPVYYHYKENTGPGLTRNLGAEKAIGEWFIFLDSDTLLPNGYLEGVLGAFRTQEMDGFGGPDKDRVDFLPIQKAISYSMTSWLTTGGIRGSTKSIERFKPRSFNMGIKREAFEALGGFSSMRYGEDIDFSLRMEKAGYQTAYIGQAYVYHKRRTTFKAFFHQVRHSGEARIALSKKHKGSFKLLHLFPSVFTLGLVASLLLYIYLPILGMVGLLSYGFYSILILMDASFKNRSFSIGLLSLAASYVQLVGYGLGLLRAGTISFFKG